MSLLIQAAKGKNNSGRPPVWMMRQAGRYQQSYRAVRQGRSFLDLVKDPQLASKVTLAALTEFPLDAGIIFSDILVVPEAMGMDLVFDENGPHFPNPIRTLADMDRLSPFQPLPYLAQALSIVKQKTDLPILGFAGAPFTLLSYMVQGKGGGNLEQTKAFLLEDPDRGHRLLSMIAESVICHLQNQVDSGADAVQLFESHGNVLSSDFYQEFAGPYSEMILSRLERPVPRVLFVRGPWIHQHWSGSADVLGIDWTQSLEDALGLGLLHRKSVQGNLDPAYLLCPWEKVQPVVTRLLDCHGHQPHWIFNLGHGIHKLSKEENVLKIATLVRGRGGAVA